MIADILEEMFTMNRKLFPEPFKGWESMADYFVRSVKSATNYPPYNIKKTGENTYLIEIGVAGFDKADLEIEMKDNLLTVKGRIPEDAQKEEQSKFLFHGLAGRTFLRQFVLANSVEVTNAMLINGVLKLYLEYMLREQKGYQIAISTPKEKKSKPEVLMESAKQPPAWPNV